MAQICTFYLDQKIYGLDILLIQEITRYHEITPVPHAPNFVSGLINLRGQIVVVINLRTMFGSPEPAFWLDPINIVLPLHGAPISLMADRAGDVFDFGNEPMVAPPKALTGHAARIIKGVYRLENSLLHVLDADAIFENEKNETNHLTKASG